MEKSENEKEEMLLKDRPQIVPHPMGGLWRSPHNLSPVRETKDNEDDDDDEDNDAVSSIVATADTLL